MDGWDQASRPAAGAVETAEVLPPAADGLAARLVRLGAGAAWSPPGAGATSGRALCVLDGELHVDGTAYRPRSIGWQSPADPSLALRGGPDGCALLALDFPHPPSSAAG